MFETLLHQPFHQSVSRIFRIGAHAGDKPHGINGVIDVHFQRIDGDLRHQRVPVKAAQHIRTFQDREFGLLDLVAAPPAEGKILLRDLKGIAQKGVVLFKVVRFQIAYVICLILHHRVLRFLFPVTAVLPMCPQTVRGHRQTRRHSGRRLLWRLPARRKTVCPSTHLYSSCPSL